MAKGQPDVEPCETRNTVRIIAEHNRKGSCDTSDM
jgi:hypothetical protein